MAVLNDYSNKRVLILDDMPEMRSNLRAQVSLLGCDKVAMSGTVKDALEQFAANEFDVVLCDYYLAGGTDGQQFLEYLRTRNIIKRSVLFVMVTAEQSYEHVITAAECMPDDYLLKPFTAEVLKVRLERLLEKKQRLEKIDRLYDKRHWPGLVQACDELIAAKDRYLLDAMRIKGTALMCAGRFEDAVNFYQQILAMRPLPWAKLGLARALHQGGQGDASKTVLSELIAESPRLVAAYDLLSEIHRASGDPDTAIAVLDQAREISPNSLARHRAIASAAEEKGDFQRVEASLEQVVKRTKFSPLRETEDFARLGNALTETGQVDKAIALIDDAKKNFKGDADHPMLAAIEAVAHHKAGNPEKAAEALARATKTDSAKLPSSVALTVAKACLTTGQQAEAHKILKTVVQGNPDAKSVHDKILGVLREHGADSMAESLVSDSMREIIELNNEAVRRARAGETTIAAEMLTEAARRLPFNLQIVGNAAEAVLFDVLTTGLQPEKLRVAQEFQISLQGQAPDHPKLQPIAKLLEQIRAKYGAAKQG